MQLLGSIERVVIFALELLIKEEGAQEGEVDYVHVLFLNLPVLGLYDLILFDEVDLPLQDI